MFKPTSEEIKSDLKWLKNELKHLTKWQRSIILQEYLSILNKYDIGIVEYNAFIGAFNDMED
jgi:hypothetical protein